MKKEIERINELLGGLKHLKDYPADSFVTTHLTYHEIPISDKVKDKVYDIIETDLNNKLYEAKKGLNYFGVENTYSSPEQNYLSNVVSAILNHLNKASEIQPDGSIILKDRKG